MVTFDEIKQKLDAIEGKLDEIEKDYQAYQDVAKMLAEELQGLYEKHSYIWWEHCKEDSPALTAYKELTGEK